MVTIRQALLIPVVVASFACSDRYDSTADRTQSKATDHLASNRQPDNTAVNERDRGDATLTPADQLENTADLTISQDIRKALTADDSLSVNAQNVKIITANGLVTLRGPVNTEQEKERIVEKAQTIAGVTRVHNQLEVIVR